MRSPFYQANFCAECGNSLAPRVGFRPRYFCDACAARLNQRRLVTPLAGLLFAASLVVFAFSYNGYRKNRAQFPPPASSARDSIVHSGPTPLANPQSSTETRVLCGARTRRGTPCRRRVLPGRRCNQHIGMPSMIETASKEAAPKSRKH